MLDNRANKDRVWNLVTITIDPASEEFASSMLFDLGTTGIVTLEESSERIKLGAYFHREAILTPFQELITSEFAGVGRAPQLLEITVAEVADQDWMQKWKEGFEPVEIGERLMIAPSWKLPQDARGRKIVQIDPGMAFGTGTHETTRLCLESIERHWRGGTLLDVGTGTGILAIAAARLQPESRISAIDVDPLAVHVAQENIAINNVTGSVDVSSGQPRDFAGRGFDAVVANLTAEVIVEQMAHIAACARPGGLLIFSGILNELRNDVERSAEERGLEIIERHEMGEWSALVSRK